jgi:glutamine amidotransferase
VTVVVIDYKTGNLGSVVNMLAKIGQPCLVSSDPDVIASASHLILIGVGSFDSGMVQLEELNLDVAIRESVRNAETKLLGICLGMQLLFNSSSEGTKKGLGLIEGTCELLLPTGRDRVPNMGWRTLTQTRPTRIFDHLDERARFYFVHSYAARCVDQNDVTATTHFGVSITAAVEKGNISGVQFHPEKSHKYGIQLLSNFCRK